MTLDFFTLYTMILHSKLLKVLYESTVFFSDADSESHKKGNLKMHYKKLQPKTE